ncbi:MAG: hypothetical protein QW041_03530 [Candidatus Pacearchaeota archaeon]
MLESEVLKLQVVSTLKLLFSGYLLFFWIPNKVFPQDYIEDKLDRIVFNIIHMVSIITLLFPFFIYIKVFGFPFLIFFLITLKLVFLKYYYKNSISTYLRKLSNKTIYSILKFLENANLYIKNYVNIKKDKFFMFISKLNFQSTLCSSLISFLFIYSLFIILYRSFISLSGALPDMYVFYYWNNILKLNILFDKTAAAPYMWGAPVLIYTVNQFSRLNTIVLYNIFPLLYLSFTLFSLYYFIKKFLNSYIAIFIALFMFGILLPSPLAHKFFGTVTITNLPEVINIWFLSFYHNANPLDEKLLDSYPFLLFWRRTTTLPYELGASFALINLYFLIKFLDTRKNIFILLYAETLAIILSIHIGIAIALSFPSILIFIYAYITDRIDVKLTKKGILVIFLSIILGNTWMLQFLIYGIPQDIGAAAPILDKFFKTERAYRDLKILGLYTVQIVKFTPFLSYIILLLLIISFIFIFYELFSKKKILYIPSIGITSIAILFIYFSQNIGLPRIIDHSRLQFFVAIVYSIIFPTFYSIFLENKLKLKKSKSFFNIYLTFISLIILILVIITPRWIDRKEFWSSIDFIEYNEYPYLVNEIEDNFQPFTYLIVSYVQQFSQVISRGYHENTQEFIQSYSPTDKYIPIDINYIFIFVENEPKEYYGLGEYWYRWRRDIMIKLKDWITIYSQNHDNIKLWYSSKNVNVFLIDNTHYVNTLEKHRKQLLDINR